MQKHASSWEARGADEEVVEGSPEEGVIMTDEEYDRSMRKLQRMWIKRIRWKSKRAVKRKIYNTPDNKRMMVAVSEPDLGMLFREPKKKSGSLFGASHLCGRGRGRTSGATGRDLHNGNSADSLRLPAERPRTAPGNAQGDDDAVRQDSAPHGDEHVQEPAVAASQHQPPVPAGTQQYTVWMQTYGIDPTQQQASSTAKPRPKSAAPDSRRQRDAASTGQEQAPTPAVRPRSAHTSSYSPLAAAKEDQGLEHPATPHHRQDDVGNTFATAPSYEYALLTETATDLGGDGGGDAALYLASHQFPPMSPGGAADRYSVPLRTQHTLNVPASPLDKIRRHENASDIELLERYKEAARHSGTPVYRPDSPEKRDGRMLWEKSHESGDRTDLDGEAVQREHRGKRGGRSRSRRQEESGHHHHHHRHHHYHTISAESAAAESATGDAPGTHETAEEPEDEAMRRAKRAARHHEKRSKIAKAQRYWQRRKIRHVTPLDESGVENMLHSIGLSRYAAQFRAQRVSGDDLLNCGDVELKQLGMTFRPHRMRLLEILHNIRANSGLPWFQPVFATRSAPPPDPTLVTTGGIGEGAMGSARKAKKRTRDHTTPRHSSPGADTLINNATTGFSPPDAEVTVHATNGAVQQYLDRRRSYERAKREAAAAAAKRKRAREEEEARLALAVERGQKLLAKQTKLIVAAMREDSGSPVGRRRSNVLPRGQSTHELSEDDEETWGGGGFRDYSDHEDDVVFDSQQGYNDDDFEPEDDEEDTYGQADYDFEPDEGDNSAAVAAAADTAAESNTVVTTSSRHGRSAFERNQSAGSPSKSPGSSTRRGRSRPWRRTDHAVRQGAAITIQIAYRDHRQHRYEQIRTQLLAFKRSHGLLGSPSSPTGDGFEASGGADNATDGGADDADLTKHDEAWLDAEIAAVKRQALIRTKEHAQRVRRDRVFMRAVLRLQRFFRLRIEERRGDDLFYLDAKQAGASGTSGETLKSVGKTASKPKDWAHQVRAEADERRKKAISRRIRDENRLVVDIIESQTTAAIGFQCLFRQYVAKLRAAALRARRDAATTIQSMARMDAARTRVQGIRKRYQASTKIQKIARARAARGYVQCVREEKAQREREAATRIQKRARVRRAKRRVSEARTQRSAATRIQCVQRRRRASKVVQERRQRRNAAIKIQSCQRKHHASGLVAQKRREKRAATRIQSGQRQHRARRMAFEKRRQRAAAVRIQSMQRQRTARTIVHQRRQFRASQSMGPANPTSSAARAYMTGVYRKACNQVAAYFAEHGREVRSSVLDDSWEDSAELYGSAEFEEDASDSQAADNEPPMVSNVGEAHHEEMLDDVMEEEGEEEEEEGEVGQKAAGEESHAEDPGTAVSGGSAEAPVQEAAEADMRVSDGGNALEEVPESAPIEFVDRQDGAATTTSQYSDNAWVCITAPVSGERFYHNTITHETRSSLPADLQSVGSAGSLGYSTAGGSRTAYPAEEGSHGDGVDPVLRAVPGDNETTGTLESGPVIDTSQNDATAVPGESGNAKVDTLIATIQSTAQTVVAAVVAQARARVSGTDVAPSDAAPGAATGAGVVATPLASNPPLSPVPSYKLQNGAWRRADAGPGPTQPSPTPEPYSHLRYREVVDPHTGEALWQDIGTQRVFTTPPRPHRRVDADQKQLAAAATLEDDADSVTSAPRRVGGDSCENSAPTDRAEQQQQPQPQGRAENGNAPAMPVQQSVPAQLSPAEEERRQSDTLLRHRSSQLAKKGAWVMYFEPDTKTPFFYNVDTRVSRWDRPEDFTVEAVRQELRQQGVDPESHAPHLLKEAVLTATDAQSLPTNDSAVEEAPDEPTCTAGMDGVVAPNRGGDWKAYLDPDTQQRYYYNSSTGESRWDLPPTAGCVSTMGSAEVTNALEADADADADGGATGNRGDSTSAVQAEKDGAAEEEEPWELRRQQSAVLRKIGEWVEYIDQTSGFPFWYNSQTGDSRWEPPEGATAESASHTSRHNTLAQPSQQSTGTSQVTAEESEEQSVYAIDATESNLGV